MRKTPLLPCTCAHTTDMMVRTLAANGNQVECRCPVHIDMCMP
jgi:hypothetical protein